MNCFLLDFQAPEQQGHEIELENEIKKTRVVKATPSHFELLKVLGQGSFGKVTIYIYIYIYNYM